jgi:hypothetical protein
MNKQVTITDIGAIFKEALDIAHALPPTNIVLRQKAIGKIKEAHKALTDYYHHQHSASQLASEKPETEEDKIRRIVAPYIENIAGNTKKIRGKTYKGELSMGVLEMHAKEILAEEAANNIGMKNQSAGAAEGASEEATGKEKGNQNTVAPLPSTSITQQGDSEQGSGEGFQAAAAAGDPVEFRPLGDLFMDGTVAGSLFGETVLGPDNGMIAAEEIQKALQEIATTTSAGSIQRGDTKTKIAEYAICLICWMLGIIEAEDINLASPSGLYQFQRGGSPTNPDKRLARKNLIEAMFARLRPDMEKKETHRKAASKTQAEPKAAGEETTPTLY